MLHKRTRLTLKEICEYYHLEDTEYLCEGFANKEYAAAKVFTDSRVFVPNIIATLTFRNTFIFNQFIGGTVSRQDVNFLARLRKEHLLKILNRDLLNSRTIPQVFIMLSILDTPEKFEFKYINKKEKQQLKDHRYKEIIDPLIDRIINHSYNDDTLKLLIRESNKFESKFGSIPVCIEMLLNKYPNELIRKLKFEIKLEGE